MGLFSKSREAIRNKNNTKSNALDYKSYSLKASVLTILENSLSSSLDSIELEVDDLDTFLEIVEMDEFKERYDIKQSTEDSNIFTFRLKEKDFILGKG